MQWLQADRPSYDHAAVAERSGGTPRTFSDGSPLHGWKAATGFILSTETKVLDAVTATLVARSEGTGALQLITHDPVKFDEPIGYGHEELSDETINVLPPKSVHLTTADLQTIRDFENGFVPDLTWFKPGDLGE